MAKSLLMVVVVPLMFNLGSVSAELVDPASSLPPASQQLSQICFAFIYVFLFWTVLWFFCSICSAKHGRWCSQPSPQL